MSRKIFVSILLASLLVLFTAVAGVVGCLHAYYQAERENQLKDELWFAAVGVETDGMRYLEALGTSEGQKTGEQYRLTWISASGTVLYDSVARVSEMDNHLNRTEVREALANQESSSVRYSDTLTEQTLYCARKLEDDSVLRISVQEATVLALVSVALRPVVLIAPLVVILSALLARWMARRIVQPLNTLDLDNPLDNDAYEELAPLLRRLSDQRLQIANQMLALRKQSDELVQITSHMNEGLIVLDNEDKVLSINPAAQRIFDTDGGCVGHEFVRIDRSQDLSTALHSAKESGHGQVLAGRNGREYQIDVSQIESGGAPIGTVLLAFDVTEQAIAERSRREFTANVSHELKTPLQAITGSVELLENGLVKQEDVPEFVHLVRKETLRLVALIEDIIRLSQLDEGAVTSTEDVNLLQITRSAADSLEICAADKGVRVQVTGEEAHVQGATGLLYEMIYNLVDNAIKYNVQGGTVHIKVFDSKHGPGFRVKDTGIGIPEEFQTRVFERFFRVDKSRSKVSGGTGLGLSIVKHVAMYHGAQISLKSALGEGTTITVQFDENAPRFSAGPFKSPIHSSSSSSSIL